MAGAKGCLALLLALLLLTGCSSMLERSYGTVEPYADRYWDGKGQDILRADCYQDLVNSLLLLVEEGTEEGSIRYYGKDAPFAKGQKARREVLLKTVSGAYLLEDMAMEGRNEADYCVFTYRMTYRPNTENIEDILSISNSQSLMDLLRLAVREGHSRVTVRFSYEISREEVRQEVEKFWEEDRQYRSQDLIDISPYPVLPGPQTCPWSIHFYPDLDASGIVEIRLR